MPTPMRTSGTRIAQVVRPKRRTDSAMNHRLAGGLSTVMLFAASLEP